MRQSWLVSDLVVCQVDEYLHFCHTFILDLTPSPSLFPFLLPFPRPLPPFTLSFSHGTQCVYFCIFVIFTKFDVRLSAWILTFDHFDADGTCPMAAKTKSIGCHGLVCMLAISFDEQKIFKKKFRSLSSGAIAVVSMTPIAMAMVSNAKLRACLLLQTGPKLRSEPEPHPTVTGKPSARLALAKVRELVTLTGKCSNVGTEWAAPTITPASFPPSTASGLSAWTSYLSACSVLTLNAPEKASCSLDDSLLTT